MRLSNGNFKPLSELSSVLSPLLRLAAASGLAIALMAAPARADDDPNMRSISISATGEVETAPDIVNISAGVVSDGDTAMAALEQNTTAMTKMVKALKEDGIDAKDLQTTNFSVQPVYEQAEPNARSVLSGYRVNNTVHVTVREIAKLGPILDELVKLGANQIDSIDFALADPSSQEDEARKRAMQVARQKAELYAAAAGVKIGKVISIEEQEQFQPFKAGAAVRMEAQSAVPIEAGTTTTAIRLNVTWELQ